MGFKREDLGNHKCCACHQGVAHDGGISFYRLSVERFILNVRGIQQTAGLEMFFGGGHTGAVLGDIMGANPDIAQPIFSKPLTLLMCEDCACMKPKPLAALVEMAQEREHPDDDTDEADTG
ncbi:hypothetical protein LCGC14_2284120 [marine sediment metagenome]|uniref:Uncharacterized protein n=1 Tax=marine sediment metagenome TaxID=412755 RepID=A0A0F9DFN5_9ZZZZ